MTSTELRDTLERIEPFCEALPCAEIISAPHETPRGDPMRSLTPQNPILSHCASVNSRRIKIRPPQLR
jgi:hypothetical protein